MITHTPATRRRSRLRSKAARLRSGVIVIAFAIAAGATANAVPASPAERTERSPSRADVRPAASPVVMAGRAACPARPRFNSVIDADGRTSFFYRPQPGQTIVGARGRGTGRVRTLMTTARGRAALPRGEITTDRVVDASRLPWFARKAGPRRVVAAILANADSRSYAGIRLAYSPKAGTYAKLILPAGTVRTTSAGCTTITGYPTIYAQNIRRGGGGTTTDPGDPATPTDPEPTVDVGPAFRLVLALPRDQQEPPGAVAAIRSEAGAVTAWFARQSANGALPRWVRTASGQIDVRVVRLPKTTAEYTAGDHHGVLADVRGVARPTRGVVADVVWIDAGSPAGQPCGVSVGGRTDADASRPMGSVLWEAACDVRPNADWGWPYGGTYLLAHEMTHLFGAARACAPHNDGSGHVTDSSKDIISATGRDWDDLRLDPGYDDYLFTGDECDIARSPMWTVTPTRPAG